jgi:hypothetical protein
VPSTNKIVILYNCTKRYNCKVHLLLHVLGTHAHNDLVAQPDNKSLTQRTVFPPVNVLVKEGGRGGVSIQFKKLYGTTIVVNSITDALLIFIFYT